MDLCNRNSFLNFKSLIIIKKVKKYFKVKFYHQQKIFWLVNFRQNFYYKNKFK